MPWPRSGSGLPVTSFPISPQAAEDPSKVQGRVPYCAHWPGLTWLWTRLAFSPEQTGVSPSSQAPSQKGPPAPEVPEQLRLLCAGLHPSSQMLHKTASFLFPH